MIRFISLIFILLIATFIPAGESSAASCQTIKKGVKIIGKQVNFSNEKGALQIVNAYRLIFDNPNCFSKRELGEMKVAAKDLLKECKNPKSPLSGLFGKKLWSKFCNGFISLERYVN